MDKCFRPNWPEGANALNRGPFGNLAWPPSPAPPADASTFLHAHHRILFSSLSPDAITEDRATAVSKSHRQAEKRRRERINAHLAALRKLILRSDKMEKATLLSNVIEHVKDLETRAGEISQTFLVPTEVDEVTVDCEESPDPTNSKKQQGNIFIKASICCEDRPELFTDINEALNDLRLTPVKADMATVGGRIINVMILRAKNDDEGTSLHTLKQTLKVVLTRVASSSVASMNVRSSRRQRFLLPSYYSQSQADISENSLCVASGSNSQPHTL